MRLSEAPTSEPAEQVCWVLAGALDQIARVEPDGPTRFYLTDPHGQIVLVECRTIARRHSRRVEMPTDEELEEQMRELGALRALREDGER